MWNRIHAHYSVYFLTYSIPSDFICICVFSFFQKIKTEKINKQNWQINCSWLRFWKPPKNPQTVVEVCVLWNALFVFCSIRLVIMIRFLSSETKGLPQILWARRWILGAFFVQTVDDLESWIPSPVIKLELLVNVYLNERSKDLWQDDMV